MGDVALGFGLTVVSLVVFLALSYWQLRRVHGAEQAPDPEHGQADDAGESA